MLHQIGIRKMDKQVIEISNDDFTLSIKQGFLCITNQIEQRKIPLDMILSVIISSHNAIISKNSVISICKNGGNIIFCDKKYNPNAITLSCQGHWLISQRINWQINSSIPLKKNLWKAIIVQKISNQALIVKNFDPENIAIEKLKQLAKTTLSNDSKNNEAQAARIYFKALFGNDFIRDRDKNDINILLNFSYIVLRSMIARAVVGSGLLSCLGIKHCAKTNTMPLVDDLMEPFRPIADKLVVEEISKLEDSQNIILSPEIKRRLTHIISYRVKVAKGEMPLNEALSIFINSLVKSFEHKKILIEFPKIL